MLCRDCCCPCFWRVGRLWRCQQLVAIPLDGISDFVVGDITLVVMLLLAVPSCWPLRLGFGLFHVGNALPPRAPLAPFGAIADIAPVILAGIALRLLAPAPRASRRAMQVL